MMIMQFKPLEYKGAYYLADESGRVSRNTNGVPFTYPNYDAALAVAEQHNEAVRNAESFWSAFKSANPEIPWRTVNDRTRVV